MLVIEMHLIRRKSFGLFITGGLVACVLLLTSGNTIPAPARLAISIKHLNGNAALQLDTVKYKNAFGQGYTISKFRYYLGKICLEKRDGSKYLTDKYFLVDEEDASSKNLLFTDVPEGDYKSISFIIGVDSALNCSGAQSDALDPVNGMFWTWSTGYIFLKLEGHADASLSPGHIFEYHIGGFKQPYNCIRKVSLSLGEKGMHASGGKENKIELDVDVAEVLRARNKIDFSKLSSVTDFHNCNLVADNYANMFSIVKQ